MKINNNNKPHITKTLLFLVVLIFLFSGCSNNSNTNISEKNENEIKTEVENINNALPSISNNEAKTAEKYTILMSNGGFSPKSLEIKKGDIVVFLNSGDDRHWPASNVHPTHTQYPGSGIEKCGTAEESKIFDACKSIKAGENYTFTFNEVGTWNFHDHVHSTLKGTIVVKE